MSVLLTLDHILSSKVSLPLHSCAVESDLGIMGSLCPYADSVLKVIISRFYQLEVIIQYKVTL